MEWLSFQSQSAFSVWRTLYSPSSTSNNTLIKSSLLQGAWVVQSVEHPTLGCDLRVMISGSWDLALCGAQQRVCFSPFSLSLFPSAPPPACTHFFSQITKSLKSEKNKISKHSIEF